MDYHGTIDLTLIYSAPGLETPIVHPGVIATLYFNAPHLVSADRPYGGHHQRADSR